MQDFASPPKTNNPGGSARHAKDCHGEALEPRQSLAHRAGSL